MAKQDDWVRLTVRLPPEIYRHLLDESAHGAGSMNAEIVSRLQRSLAHTRSAQVLARQSAAALEYDETRVDAEMLGELSTIIERLGDLQVKFREQAVRDDGRAERDGAL